ncbi:L10-interacting MYB domain-containing protein-like [Durio zibethinus]|uniref:L10-interacting MYB domain-containing protein-like n=1 Tax=Durio zibethinus TaxID=66656 RepID=A0A6P5WTN7_DURZI|nr:L10-interacting MYB domain-containing protein-like [Durio zibethinus]XP_022719183.1 L10-interacting MYB domain-containing protein-like [Durio zibethinus]XP_022719184.1 L10-interacting MYB domain-containing protein-like [Durio zibethinus]
MKNARIVTAEVPRGRNNDKMKAVWDRNLTIIFCDLCIKEKDHNCRRGTYFKKEGWSRLVSNFNKETGKEYEKSQLKNRWDLLKKEWKLWKQLKGNDTCLGWDSTKNNIDTSDAWWEKKLKLMPEATKFKNGGIDPELENKLDWMFQGINDDITLAPTFGLPPTDGIDDDELPKVEVEVFAVEDIEMPKKAMDEHFNEINNHCMEQNPQPYSESEHQSEPPHQKKRSPESGSSDLNKGKEKVPKLVGRVSKLSWQIDRLCSAAESMSTATSAKLTSEPYTIPEAVRLLDNMEEEVPKKSLLYYFATKLLLNKDKRTMFMSLSTETRAWWLKMEMKESSKVSSNNRKDGQCNNSIV